MHVDKIYVFNYKSLIYQMIAQIISPGINILTGLNGTGKTNFLNAIKNLFVDQNLSKKYTSFLNKSSFKQNDKKSYSFVQICINNKEKIFPISCDQITIKKVNGFKVEKILINNYSFNSQNFFDFLALTKLGIENFISCIDQGFHSVLKYNTSYQKLKIFKKKTGTDIYEKYKKKSILILEKTNASKKKLTNLINLMRKKIQKIIQSIFLNKKKKFTKKFLFYFYIISIFDKKSILKKKKKNLKAFKILKKHRIFSIILRLLFIKLDKERLDFKKNSQKQNKNDDDDDKKDSFWFRREQRSFFFLVLLKIQIYMSLILKESDKDKWTTFSEKFFIFNFLNWFKKKFSFPKNYFYFQKILNKIIYNLGKKKNYFKKILYFFQKNNNQTSFFEFFYSMFKNNKKNKILFFQLKLYRFNVKRKIYFYLNEISIEKEILQKILFVRENKIENFFGNKIINGIRNTLFLLKKKPNLKTKIFGVFVDLVCVHKYFSRSVENFLKNYLNHIIIKNQKTAIKIINMLKKKGDFAINFLVNEKIVIYDIKLKKISDGFPVIGSLFFSSKFETLIRKIVKNSFFIKKKFKWNNSLEYKETKFLTLDGKIYNSTGTLSFEISSNNESIFDVIILLKKERIFFDWMDNLKKKLNFFFQNFQNNFFNWWLVDIIYKKLINYFHSKIFSKKKKSEKNKFLEKYNYFKKKKEKKFIFFKKKRNFSKFNFFKKKLKNNFDLIIKIKSSDILPLKFKYFLYSRIFFFYKTFSSYFTLSTFKLNKSLKNFIPNLWIVSFLKEKKYNGLKIYRNLNYFSFHKKKFFFKLIYSLFNLKKKNDDSFEFLNTYKKLLIREAEFIFKNNNKENKAKHFSHLKTTFKSFSYFKKFSMKKRNIVSFLKIENKKLFKLKVYKIVWYFREIETDIFIINQTFAIFEKKKNNIFRQSLLKISDKFSRIFKTVTNGGRAYLIIHYKDIFHKYFRTKKEFAKKITGLSILAKFQKEGYLSFCEQMSDGQVSFVFGLLIISFREILKPEIYLLDEIDTNLDPKYGKILSYVIKQLSSSQIQFFVSTFKKSILVAGDRWFGTSIKNSKSKFEKISKKNAFKFVDKKKF